MATAKELFEKLRAWKAEVTVPVRPIPAGREGQALTADAWNEMFNRANGLFAGRVDGNVDISAALMAHALQEPIDADGVHGIRIDGASHTMEYFTLGNEYGDDGLVSWQQLSAFAKAPVKNSLGTGAEAMWTLWNNLWDFIRAIEDKTEERDEAYKWLLTVQEKVLAMDRTWLQHFSGHMIFVAPVPPSSAEIAALGDFAKGRQAIWIDSSMIGH